MFQSIIGSPIATASPPSSSTGWPPPGRLLSLNCLFLYFFRTAPDKFQQKGWDKTTSKCLCEVGANRGLYQGLSSRGRPGVDGPGMWLLTQQMLTHPITSPLECHPTLPLICVSLINSADFFLHKQRLGEGVASVESCCNGCRWQGCLCVCVWEREWDCFLLAPWLHARGLSLALPTYNPLFPGLAVLSRSPLHVPL